MIVETLSELDPKIVVFGQSCSGKTTFAKSLPDHPYHCFDSIFEWHAIETLGLSIEANLRYVSKICNEDSYILDGWHLADKEGRYLPKESMVYVVYATYDRIVDQYRIPVLNREEFRPMFHKWYYEIEYPRLPCRYFANEGIFRETTEKEFQDFLSNQINMSNSSGMS